MLDLLIGILIFGAGVLGVYLFFKLDRYTARKLEEADRALEKFTRDSDALIGKLDRGEITLDEAHEELIRMDGEE